MIKSIKTLAMVVVVTQIVLFLSGCSNNSVTGTYYRDFGSYTSSTMYIDLKKDKTYQTDGTAPGLASKGTYETSGTNITFTFENPFNLLSQSDTEDTLTGTITGGTLTIEGATYKK